MPLDSKDDPYFTPDPSPTPRRSGQNYDEIIKRHSQRTGLDENLIRAVIGQESSGNKTAISPKGARGLMQLMPATAKRFGVKDVNNPEDNIRGGTEYLKFLHDRYKGDTDKILAGYNAGEGAVDKFGGIPPYKETRNYVPAVKARYQRLTSQPFQQALQDKYFTQQPAQSDPYFTPDVEPQGRGASMAQTQKVKPRVRSPQVVTPEMVTRSVRGGMQGQQPQSIMRIQPRAMPNDSDTRPFANNPLMPRVSRSEALAEDDARQQAEAKQAENVKRGLRNVNTMVGSPLQVLPDAAQDWINTAMAEGGAAMMGTAAGLIKHGIPTLEIAKLFGAPDILQKPVAEKLAQASRQISSDAQLVDERSGRGVVSKTLHNVVAGGIGSSPAVILTSLGVPASVAFGIQANAEAQGQGKGLLDTLSDTVQGATIGKLFELPMPVKLGLLQKAGVKFGTVGGATYGLDKLKGNPDAFTNALVQGAFAATGVGEREPVQGETLTQVPDIQAKLVERAQQVEPTIPPPSIAAKRTALREGSDANQIEAQPNVAAQPESTQPAEPNISDKRAAAQAAVDQQRGVAERVGNAGQSSSTQTGLSRGISEGSESPRHVDLQKRVSRGPNKGDFAKESRAERLTRQQQVNPPLEANPSERLNTPLDEPAVNPVEQSSVDLQSQGAQPVKAETTPSTPESLAIRQPSAVANAPEMVSLFPVNKTQAKVEFTRHAGTVSNGDIKALFPDYDVTLRRVRPFREGRNIQAIELTFWQKGGTKQVPVPADLSRRFGIEKPFGRTEEPQLASPEVSATTPLAVKEGQRPLPDWVRENIQSKVKQADSIGVSDRIEQLSAERKTAAEVVNALAQERPDLARVKGDLKGLVQAIRSDRGIPSMDDKAEFESWLKSREATGVQRGQLPAVEREPLARQGRREFVLPRAEVNQPLAAEGLTSYRYRSDRGGQVAIGAKNSAEALSEAARSISDKPDIANLDVWDGEKYVPVSPPSLPPSEAVKPQAASARSAQGKEPWEMTRDQYGRDWYKRNNAKAPNVDEVLTGVQQRDARLVREGHLYAVRKALEQGKPVPKEVLADYPDLAKEVPRSVKDQISTPPPVKGDKYFTPEPSTPSPKTTGIARRVEESRRAELGQEPPPKGEGISGAESVKHGRELLAEGRSPEQAISDFKKNGSISADSVALVRAKHEELARVANQAFDEGGLDSSKFKAAEKARQDYWENSVRPMQTEWHKTGMAQQGETDIDTGTFYGLYRGFKQETGREMSSREQRAAQDLSAKVASAETGVHDANRALVDALNNATGVKDLDPQVQKALNRFVEQSQRETRAQRRQQTKKTLDEEAALIKQNIAAEFARLKSQAGQGRNLSQQGLGLLDPEGTITKAVIKLAKNRVKAGITDTAQLIDDVHGAVKEFADVSRRQVAEVIAGLGLRQSERKQSDWMNVKGAVRKGLKAESQTQTITDAANRIAAGGRVAPEDVKTLWRYATGEYIDKGVEFGDAVQKTAQDLKMSPDQLRHALGTQVGVKPLTDAMYRRMAARRDAKAAAHQWVRNADKSPGMKAVQGVADAFFNLATFGHGTVGPVTHAAENIFHPTRWVNYFKNVGRTYKSAYSSAAHERYMQDLVNDPNYTIARRAGLANEPGKFYDEYQNTLAQKMFGAVGKIGNRGFDVLKRMRQDFFNQRWEKLDETQKTTEMAQAIADLVNHSTGAIRTKIPYAGLARGVFFAPPLEASRWARILGDPIRAADTFTNWKSATPSEKYFAKGVVKNHAGFLATYLASLALNQAVLTSSGSDDKVNFTDPSRSDWLRHKIKGRTLDLSGGVIGSIGLLARLGQASFGEQNPREGRFSRIGSALTDYGRGKLSPLASVGTDVLTQSDFRGRPMPFSSDTEREGRPRYTWPEYALSRTSPIPVSEGARDFFDEMHKQGVPVDTTRAIFNAAINHPSTLMKGVGIGAISGSTGVRIGAEFSSPSKATDIEGQRQGELRRIERDSRSGKDVKSEIDEGIKSGILKETDRDLIGKKAKLTALQSRFDGKSLPQALDAYEDYNEPDRAQVKDMLRQKAAIVDTLPLASQQDIRDRLNKLGFKPGLQIPKRPTVPGPERPNPRAWSYQQ